MIRAIEGQNFSGKSHYLKCFTKYPTSEVLESLRKDGTTERDTKHSLYIHPIASYAFTGIFDTVYNELLRLKTNQLISLHIREFIERIAFDRLYEQHPFSLSGGEQTLLAILSAVLMNPKALAIDTTMEQLDNENKTLLLSFLNELSIADIIFSDNRISEIPSNLYHKIDFTPVEESIENALDIQPIKPDHYHCKTTQKDQYLEVSNLYFSYGKKRIFNNFSMHLHSGVLYHLKGKNGKGKSTLAKLITGILNPKGKSSFYLNKKEIQPYRYPGKYCGYCFQQPDEQLFSTSVRGELNHSSRKDFNHSIVKTFGLDRLGNEHPFDLPTSLRKRLVIAATLTMDRPVYIFDEPTLYQDSQTVLALAKLFDQLIDSGKIVMIISHSDSFLKHFKKVETIQL